MVTFPGNVQLLFARPRHLAHGRGAARRAARGRGAAARHRPRLTLIDTAEMYGDGGAEELVGAEAIARAAATRSSSSARSIRTTPARAARSPPASAACSASRLDRIDLYLLHWRGSVPLAETRATPSSALQRAGKIRHWGVSNFDAADMEELLGVPGGEPSQTNQVLYNLARRGIEFDLLPWLPRAQHPADGLFADRAGRAARNADARGARQASAARRRRRSRSPGCSRSEA